MRTTLKSLTGILLFSVHAMVFSQNFIDGQKQWTLLINYWPGEPINNYKTKYYKFSGDTFVNGKTYSKLYESADSQMTNRKLNKLWREINDSIFQYNSGLNDDRLMYNFNLKPGDTFYVNDHLTLKVDSVSVKYWGDRNRKHWYLGVSGGSSPGITTWIEGVGQNGYFVRSSDIFITGPDFRILCFHEKGRLVYQNPDFNSCFVESQSVIPEINPDLTIKIYVTESGICRVSNPASEKGVLVIYSTDGRLVKKLKIEPDNTEFEFKKSGLFIYMFINPDGKIQSGKIIGISELF